MTAVRTIYRIALLLVSGVVLSACSVTRHIPDGQYLVNKVTVEEDDKAPKRERIPSSDFEKYIRQTPNKRFLGTNFYVWLYDKANPQKKNKWNNWKRRVGQAPVLLDMSLTQKSAKNLKVYMDTKGFFSSYAAFEVDTTSKKKKANIRYRVHQGAPYIIDTVSYEFNDKALRSIILPDTAHTLVRKGEIFDITRLDAERERVTAMLKDKGYFNFSVGNISYVADTLMGDHKVAVKVVFKQYLTGYDERGQAIMENNMVYRLGKINVFPNFDPAAVRTDTTLFARLDTMSYRGLNIVYDKRMPLRPRILRNTIPLYPNYIYNATQVNHTYSDLMSLGYFRSARISFREEPRDEEQHTYVTYIGQGVDSVKSVAAKEGYLTCNILCTPTLKQSIKLELEGSTTSSFYGLKATVGYQNRNIFRGAESFDVSLTTGYEFMKAPDARKKRASEVGINTSLTFPRFLLPWHVRRYKSVNQPKTKLELSVNFQDRPYYRRTLSSVGLTYSWANSKYSTFSLKPIDINVVDVSYLDEDFLKHTQNQYLINSYRSQLIAGLTFSYVFNNQMKNMGRNATNIRFNFETSGNLLDGLEHLFSKPKAGHDYYTIFDLRYAQYFRTDLSISRKIMLGEKAALAGRLYGGVAVAYGNSETVPFDRLFYSGGSNSMRGWTPRTLGPGSVIRPETEFPTQLGDMKLEANLELRFPIWGMIHGATFFDLGNIWFLKKSGDYSSDGVFYLDRFYKQLAFNTGIGLRLDIKFAVLRLDWGVQLHNPNNPAGERWIKSLKWKNTALNFGVGYPF